MDEMARSEHWSLDDWHWDGGGFLVGGRVRRLTGPIDQSVLLRGASHRTSDLQVSRN